MNAALNIGTREYEPQNRRQRFETLLARVRRRQLDLAMTGQVVASARYASRAAKLAEQIVIVSQMSGDSDRSAGSSHARQDELELACCGV